MIRFDNVSKYYNKTEKVLDEINLTIENGEFVSIIGPSGAGKTTFIRLINGSVALSKGNIIIDDVIFNTLKGRNKREVQGRIGTIFQDFCLVEESTCLQNVLNAELGKMSLPRVIINMFTREQKERAIEALCEVGLGDKIYERVKNLSGGQKQRVAIARALMQRPTIILADEPVASLDPYTAKEILELLKKLQVKEKLTVVMNSHNLEQALNYSDRVIGIRVGKIVVDTVPEQIGDIEEKAIYGK